MKYIADLHIHSHFSMATSKQLAPEYLNYWARLKGIGVVGTGDFTHPAWLQELQEKLEPAGDGLFTLKKEWLINDRYTRHLQDAPPTRFMLTAEISNIYKKYGKVRKIHNVAMAPDFATVEEIQRQLSRQKFNITSDGRPILGMDARDLVELIMEAHPQNIFIPAHIWTPWFSALGAKSGFNSIEEAFQDMARHIFAVETGLSSDPPMNWMISDLDKFTLVANSDAHSPEKLGRNANVLHSELSYQAIREAMQSGDPERFGGTIDMFPQAGKYHYAGHRKCGIRWDPVEALRHNNTCPVCGKKITGGVMNRVVELSDRINIQERPGRLPFRSIIPLKEMLAEIHGVGENTQTVKKAYHQLLEKFGTEFNLLLEASLDDLRQDAGRLIAEAVRRMRNRQVHIKEGFDGQYGEIKVFAPGELKQLARQNQLFGGERQATNKPERPLLNFDLEEYRRLKQTQKSAKYDQPRENNPGKKLAALSAGQQEAARHYTGPALVLAGPGTGKTRVLTERMAWLCKEQSIPFSQQLALTFTHKAAGEMTGRLKSHAKGSNDEPAVFTFHAFALQFLKTHYKAAERQEHFQLVDDDERLAILGYMNMLPANKHKKALRLFSALKQRRMQEEELEEDIAAAWHNYQKLLKKYNLLDMDDLLFETTRILSKRQDILQEVQQRYPFVLVDEYQDINQIQYDLLQLLTNTQARNLYAIGDPNQAIYGFRGADIRFISRFRKDFPEAAVYQLTQSYRCSSTIIQASGNVLQVNGLEENFLQGMDSQVKLQVVDNATAKSEAEYIARKIEEMMGGLRFFSMDSNISKGNEAYGMESLADFAVLARTRNQLPAIAEAMENHSIPYEIVGDQGLMQNPGVKKLIALIQQLLENTDKPWQKGRGPDNDSALMPEKVSLPEVVKELAERYIPEFAEEQPLVYDRVQYLARQHNQLADFVRDIILRGEIDVMKGGERVSLMTLHASKGLEFNAVFIAGMEDGLMPLSMFGIASGREEERRLLYVGMTRAKKYLFLTHARKRQWNNKLLELKRSPFVNQIERRYYEQQVQEAKIRPDGTQLNLFG